MAKIIKTYTQKMPAVRFIGKRFGDEDRVGGNFGKYWGDAFAENWFGTIEEAAGGADKCAALYEDGDAYIGLMRAGNGIHFEYWVGMFTPAGTPVPEGFDYVDFDESELGVAWIKGKQDTGDIYGKESLCMNEMVKAGITFSERDVWWFFERYGCPRFTNPDENGEVILDICFFR